MNMLWSTGGDDSAATSAAPRPTVRMYLQRLQNATIASDRRDIVSELKEVAVSHQSELGEGIPVLLGILRSEEDRQDDEMAEGVLRILLDIVTPEDDSNAVGDSEPCLVNTEALVKDHRTVELLLDLLRARALWVRLLTIKLLTALLYNRPEKTEAAVMSCGGGMMRLTDVLEDSREEIRYELLLLLLKLTELSEQVSNSIAFQEGFDKLFLIMQREGLEDGGIIIRDCLQIVRNMLTGHLLTRKLFIQSSNLRHVTHILRVLPDPAAGDDSRLSTGDSPGAKPLSPPPTWGEDQRACVELALGIVAALAGVPLEPPAGTPATAPPAPPVSAGAGYGAGASAGAPPPPSAPPSSASSTAPPAAPLSPAFEPPSALFEALVRLGTTCPHVDQVTRLLAFRVLEGVVGTSEANKVQLQLLCVSIMVAAPVAAPAPTNGHASGRPPSAGPASTPSPTPTPALTLLVKHSLFCGGDSDAESAAALAVLRAYLHDYPAGQLGLVGHVVAPPPAAALGLPDDAVPPLPPGQHVVSTLVRAAPSALLHTHDDQVITLFRACRLMTLMLAGDVTAKDLALRIVSGPTLFDQVCVHTLAALGASGPQSALVRVALTRLLSEWLTDCPAAVDAFLGKPANLTIFDVAAEDSSRSTTPPMAVAHSSTPAADVTTTSPLAPKQLSRCLAALLIATSLRSVRPDTPPPDDGKPGRSSSPVPSPSGVDITQSTVLRMITSRVTVSTFGRLLDELSTAVATPWPSARGVPPPISRADYRLVFVPDWAADIPRLHAECKRLIVALYTTPASDKTDALRREVVQLQEEKAAAAAERDAAVSQLEALRDEHADLLVLIAEQEFTVVAFKAALQNLGGDAAVHGAAEEAQRQLEAFCEVSKGGLEDDEHLDASSCSPAS